ncbi:MAG: hypothetical protein IIZ67_07280 [Bacilli bacterium]|nr:hypothetical protein [Bacilli bacterium]
MKQIKIRNKNYNCSNAIYYHIQGLESENRLFNMEIKGHEQSEFELSKRIDKALSYLRDIGNWLRDDSSYRAKLIDILQGVDKE